MKKNTRRGLIGGLILVLWFSFGGGNLLARNQSAFLRNGPGAQAMALGGAYQALVGNPQALYWNPAGLAQIYGQVQSRKKRKKKPKQTDKKNKKNEKKDNKEGDEIWDAADIESLMEEPALTDADITDPDWPDEQVNRRTFRMEWNLAGNYYSLDRQLAFVGTGFSNVFGGSMGVGAIGTQVTDLIGADASGNKTGNFDYQAMSGMLGWAREAGNVRLGFTGKYINESIDTYSYQGGGLDAGMQLDLFSSFFRVGLVLHNLATVVSSPVETRNEVADRILATAVTVNPPTVQKVMVTFSAKSNISYSEETEIGMGLRYRLGGSLNLMLGYSTTGASMGFGLAFDKFNLDFAVAQDSLSSAFNSAVEMNFAF